MEKLVATTVSDSDAERIQVLPKLSTFLPINFLNGATLNGLTVSCSGCGCELGSDTIQAEVDNNGFKAVVRAYGVCIPCRVLTPLEVRLRDDGSMLVKSGTSWSEGFYAAERQIGIMSQIRLLLSKLIIK